MTEAPLQRIAKRRDPVTLLLNLFSNVWTGITLAALLFVFCTIGSAVPQIRQRPFFEMTEFQWFHWWPFNLLVALFALNIAVITIRRIPLRFMNSGVWMIHTGIITLVIGSYYYFSTKIEGDAPVFRRQVAIDVPGAAGTARLVSLPGVRETVRGADGDWQFTVQSTNHAWPILSGEDEGATAYSVNVMVQPPGGEAFIRQLLAGYPQYTEDIIPGQGRAVKSTGKKLLDDELEIRLELEPQTHFHIMQTWALYTREVGDVQWVERPIEGMPRYNDRLGDRELVFHEPDDVPPLRPIDLEVPPVEGDPLGLRPVRITGFLRYAQMQQRWRDGGPSLNPVLNVALVAPHAEDQRLDLVAFDRRRSEALQGSVRFVWLDSAEEVTALPRNVSPVLSIRVADSDVAIEKPLTQADLVGGEGAFTPLGESGFSYRVVNLHDRLALPEGGNPISVAMVDVKTPDGQMFTRMVADRPERTRDMIGEVDPHAPAAREPTPPDPRISMSYRPAGAPLTFAGYPGGLHFIMSAPGGQQMDRAVNVGESIPVAEGVAVRINSLMLRAAFEVKPYVVPHNRRIRDAAEMFSMIRLEIDTGRGSPDRRWVRFNRYALPSEDYTYDGRFAYTPERFMLDDGRIVEVLFSRERAPLPAAIGLDDFALDTHIGGYEGSISSIRNYVSKLRFWDGEWSEPASIAVNSPTDFGGFWYFQSMWDKPPREAPTDGMNYTGLGVGNRNGVHIQLFGCVLSVVGMFFAFYVKPVLKRRRSEQQKAKVGRAQEKVFGAPRPEPVEAGAAR